MNYFDTIVIKFRTCGETVTAYDSVVTGLDFQAALGGIFSWFCRDREGVWNKMQQCHHRPVWALGHEIQFVLIFVGKKCSVRTEIIAVELSPTFTSFSSHVSSSRQCRFGLHYVKEILICFLAFIDCSCLCQSMASC